MRRTIVMLMIAASALMAAVPTAGGQAQGASVALHQNNISDTAGLDEAAMVLIGTLLIGIAAALRRVS